MRELARRAVIASSAWLQFSVVIGAQTSTVANQTSAMVMTVGGFPDGGEIPLKYSQAAAGIAPGEGVSPPISWLNAPAGTQSFVLSVRDLDMPSSRTTDDQTPHWLVWNIPASATGLPEGVPRGQRLTDGSFQISATGPMYRGPGAAATGPPHHYLFELFALKTALSVLPTADAFETRNNVLSAVKANLLAKAVYVGRFRRPQ